LLPLYVFIEVERLLLLDPYFVLRPRCVVRHNLAVTRQLLRSLFNWRLRSPLHGGVGATGGTSNSWDI